MKAIIEFSLPEDNQEFELHTKAIKMFSTLWELDQWLRGEIKYKDKELDEVRDKLREIMNDNRIDFGMVE